MIFFRADYALPRFAALAAAMCLGASSAAAADTAIFRFLRRPVSPRHIAMGEISSSFSPEPLGIAQNPSLASFVRSREAAFSGASLFGGAALDFAAAGVLSDTRSGGPSSGFTISLLTSSQERTLAPASMDNYLFADAGSFTTYSSAVGGFYSVRVKDSTYFGVSGKFVTEKLYSQTYLGAAADIALTEAVDADSFFCLGARNVGASLSAGGYTLPSSAYVSIMSKSPAGVSVVIEGEYDLQGFGEGKLGAEIPVARTFYLRLGFRHPFKERDTGDFLLSRATAGFGIKVERSSFDYAWQPLGELGSSHVVSVRKKL